MSPTGASAVPGHLSPASTREALVHGVVLAVLCVISFSLITDILARAEFVSRADDSLGGMWAVVATLFAATCVSFALCFVYLLILAFHVWGMASLIGMGALIATLLGRPDDTITMGITTAVIMVVAAARPDKRLATAHSAPRRYRGRSRRRRRGLLDSPVGRRVVEHRDAAIVVMTMLRARRDQPKEG